MSAVIDPYLQHPGSVCDPGSLCLRLLGSIALVLGRPVPPSELDAVLESAATRKSPPEATDRPVAATMSALEDSGLVAGYAQSPWSVAVQDGTKSVVTQLSAYALSPKDGRLPVLPIALELYRHQHEWQPLTLRVGDVDDGWQLTLTMATDTTPSGLASARIES